MLKKVMLIGACILMATWTADACLHRPREFSVGLKENAQLAMIVHHNGYEDIVLRIQYEFERDAKKLPKELAWVIPTPNTPILYEIADHQLFRDAQAMIYPPKGRNGKSRSSRKSRKKSPLKFLTKVVVDDYEIQPIKAVGKGAGKALNLWLSKNDFGEVPVKNMTYYTERHWTFLAVKLKKEIRLSRAGVLPPLRIRFKSKDIVFPLKFSSHQGEFDVSLFLITSRKLSLAQLFWDVEKFGFHIVKASLPFSVSKLDGRKKSLHKLLTTLDARQKIPNKLFMTKLLGLKINGPKNKVKDWTRDFSISLPAKEHRHSKLDRLDRSLKELRKVYDGKSRYTENMVLEFISEIGSLNKDKAALGYLFEELGRARGQLKNPYRNIGLRPLIGQCRNLSLKRLRPVTHLISSDIEPLPERRWNHDIDSFLRLQGEVADQLCLEMLQSNELGWQDFAINTIRMSKRRSDLQGKLTPTRQQFLMLAFKNENSLNRYNALRGTPSGPISPELTAALKLLLKDKNQRVRDEAEKVWAQRGRVNDLWPSIVKKLESGTKDQRYAAVQSMGALPGDSMKAVPHLLKTLNDKEFVIRQIAASTLGRFHKGAEQIVPVLIKLLKDPKQKEMHASAIFALSSLGARAKVALPLIKARLADKDPSTRRAARASLMNRGSDTAAQLTQLMKVYKTAELRMKFQIIDVLSLCGAAGTPHFIDLLASPDLDDRALAAIGISGAGIPNEDYVPGLLNLALEKKFSKALDGRDVRTFAINALGYMKTDALATLPLLKKYAKWSNEDFALSVHASFALWRINGSTERFFSVTSALLSLRNFDYPSYMLIKSGRLDAVRNCLIYLKIMGESGKVKEREVLALLKERNQSWCHRLTIEVLQQVSAGNPETITHLKLLLGDKELGDCAKAALTEIQRRRSKKSN